MTSPQRQSDEVIVWMSNTQNRIVETCSETVRWVSLKEASSIAVTLLSDSSSISHGTRIYLLKSGKIRLNDYYNFELTTPQSSRDNALARYWQVPAGYIEQRITYLFL